MSSMSSSLSTISSERTRTIDACRDAVTSGAFCATCPLMKSGDGLPLELERESGGPDALEAVVASVTFCADDDNDDKSFFNCWTRSFGSLTPDPEADMTGVV